MAFFTTYCIFNKQIQSERLFGVALVEAVKTTEHPVLHIYLQ